MTLNNKEIKTIALGQTGYYFEIGTQNFLIDPYLSDYVRKKEGEKLKRLIPIPMRPDEFEKVDWLLLTHAHIDHCDPETILPLIKKFNNLKILGPRSVCEILMEWGVKSELVNLVTNDWLTINDQLKIKAVPAAHPVIKQYDDGTYNCVGYLIDYLGKKIYHSGDTSVNIELIDVLQAEKGIDVGFISVNECNYYRNKAGIIGNMSVREAFQFADEVGVKTLIPMHWDMFEVNSVYQEEIELLYNLIKPGFSMVINPTDI